MKTFSQFIAENNEAKTCPAGKYWCFDSKKCKKIPLGWYVGRGGYLEKDDEEKKNGNGNGNGDSGSDAGGDGGGGMSEDYKKLPRDRMEKQYDRKKDKNWDEFYKQNPMGVGPRVSRGKSDTEIDKHGNSRQTKRISGQLKNNPRFYDDSHEQWQRMQSKFKSKKNSNAAGEVARRLNPKSYGEGYVSEARSKDQQIRGQIAMLQKTYQKEYDKMKDVPPPSKRKKPVKKPPKGQGGSPYQVYKAPKVNEDYKKFPSDKVEKKLKTIEGSIEKNPKDLGFRNTLKKRRIGNLRAELSTDERERESQSKFISKTNKLNR